MCNKMVSVGLLLVAALLLSGCVQITGASSGSEGVSSAKQPAETIQPASETEEQTEETPSEIAGADGTGVEQPPSPSAEGVLDISQLSETTPVKKKDYTGDEELDGILNTIMQDTQNVTDYLTQKLDDYFEAAGGTYEGYVQHKQQLVDWYALAEGESQKLYDAIQANCDRYHEILLTNDAYSEYKVWNKMLSESYDVWNKALGNYYGDWNDLYSDIYQECSDMINDTPEGVSYDERSDLWEEMYDTRSDSWEEMYDLRSDAWELLYDTRGDVWEELYDRR